VPKRGIRDWIAGLFGWRPYRCHECRHTFYDRPSAQQTR